MAAEIQCHGCSRKLVAPESWIGGPHRLTCTSCEFVHSVMLGSIGSVVVRVDPVTRFAKPDLAGVSKPVARDIDEGIRAANGGCARAAVVMLRRALERACIEAGAKPRDRLVDKIEHLKKGGILSPIRAGLAHNIRAFANEYGAHPDDDLLDDVSDEELEAAISLTTGLIEGLAKAKSQTKAKKPAW